MSNLKIFKTKIHVNNHEAVQHSKSTIKKTCHYSSPLHSQLTMLLASWIM